MIRFVPGVDRGDSPTLPTTSRLSTSCGRVGTSRGSQLLGGGRPGEPRLLSKKPQTRIPDSRRAYANFDGTPHATGLPQIAIFGYDSWRTASNWSVDWSWWQMAPQEQQLSDRIQAFFTSQDWRATVISTPSKATAQPASLLRTSGKQRGRRSGCNQSTGKGLREALWDSPLPSASNATTTACSTSSACCTGGGQFRIWNPRQPAWLFERDRPPGYRLTLRASRVRRPEQSGSPYHDRGRAPGRRRGQGRLAVERLNQP